VRIGLPGHGRVASTDRTAAEVVVLQERLRLPPFFHRVLGNPQRASASAWARNTWLRRNIGESPITSIPLNFGSMMVLPTAVLTPRASPSTKRDRSRSCAADCPHQRVGRPRTITPYAASPSISLSSMTAPRAFSATMPIEAPPWMRFARITAPAPTKCTSGPTGIDEVVALHQHRILPATIPMPSSVNLLSWMPMTSSCNRRAAHGPNCLRPCFSRIRCLTTAELWPAARSALRGGP